MTTRIKQLKAEIKKAGYSTKEVSVSGKNSSMCQSINVSILSENVKIDKVRTMAKKYADIKNNLSVFVHAY